MKKIIICGNYGAGNIGDEAILMGILNDIQKIDSQFDITVFSGNAKETMNTYSDFNLTTTAFIPSGPRSFINFFIKKHYKSTLKALKESKVMILGGGGLFTDHETIKAPFTWFIQAIIARLYNNKVVIYSTSVGPLKSQIAKILTKYTYNHSKLITVRDEKSANLLKKIGVKKDIFITTDPALSIQFLTKNDQKNYAIVSLRHLVRTNKLYEKNLISFFKFLINQNSLSLYLIPFGRGQIYDKEYLSKLIDQNNLPKNRIKIIETNSVYQMLQLFDNAKFCIGMRLHSLIFSILTSTPFIGLNYSEKVINFIKSFELEEFVLNLNNITLENLKEKYYLLNKHEKEIKQHIKEKLREKQELSQKNIKLLSIIK